MSSTSTASATAKPQKKTSSNTGRDVGIGVGVGVGVPVVLAVVGLAWFYNRRRKSAASSFIADKEEDPFQANIDQYHTTNPAANF